MIRRIGATFLVLALLFSPGCLHDEMPSRTEEVSEAFVDLVRDSLIDWAENSD